VCSREAPVWQQLATEGTAVGIRVKWLSIATRDLTSRGLKRDNVAVDAILMPDMGVQRAYRVASVPQVLVMSSEGRVEWSHHGALSAEQQVSLRQALRRGLPAQGQ
jgi:hypothetical protein